MFPGIVTVADGKVKQAPLTKEQVDIEMAAHGGTIVEIEKVNGKWRIVLDGQAQQPHHRGYRDGVDRPGRRP